MQVKGNGETAQGRIKQSQGLRKFLLSNCKGTRLCGKREFLNHGMRRRPLRMFNPIAFSLPLQLFPT